MEGVDELSRRVWCADRDFVGVDAQEEVQRGIKKLQQLLRTRSFENPAYTYHGIEQRLKIHSCSVLRELLQHGIHLGRKEAQVVEVALIERRFQ